MAHPHRGCPILRVLCEGWEAASSAPLSFHAAAAGVAVAMQAARHAEDYAISAVATHPCKKRKDGAATFRYGKGKTERGEGWASPRFSRAPRCTEPIPARRNLSHPLCQLRRDRDPRPLLASRSLGRHPRIRTHPPPSQTLRARPRRRSKRNSRLARPRRLGCVARAPSPAAVDLGYHSASVYV